MGLASATEGGFAEAQAEVETELRRIETVVAADRTLGGLVLYTRLMVDWLGSDASDGDYSSAGDAFVVARINLMVEWFNNGA